MAKKDAIEKFISENVHYSKNKDDLLDVHIGNPLRRITELLEEIKRQKAFSFTLKGSLGIAGVALALGVFGVLGGGRILCDKGIQTQIGTLKILNVQEKEPDGLPIISNILDWFNPKPIYNRTVLIREDSFVIRLPYSKEVNFSQYNNFQVIATGDYDSCGQTLTIKDASAVEINASK
ncbi:MAG: hypothetical protein HY427_02495 [Candidatus Levybacteria bacterium]|nr:hypothetical protein [Candidatus Levybacteria bacterium]